MRRIRILEICKEEKITEKEKMLKQKPYDTNYDKDLLKERANATFGQLKLLDFQGLFTCIKRGLRLY